MDSTADEMLHEVVDVVHQLQRDIAVLTERLANERGNRDNFTLTYERRHKELQDEIERFKGRMDVADKERGVMALDVAELKVSLAKLALEVSAIAKNIQWAVYLVLGAVILAAVAQVVVKR